MSAVAFGGSGAMCFISDPMYVDCFGNNAFGQLGNNSTTLNNSFTTVGPAVSIAMGSQHTCATDTTNKLWCWGSNGYGQFGNGTTTQALLPLAMPNTWQDVAATNFGTCARDRLNAVWCWGNNLYGEVGDGTTTLRYAPPATPTLSATFSGGSK